MTDVATRDSGNEDDVDKAISENLAWKVALCSLVWATIFGIIFFTIIGLCMFAGFTIAWTGGVIIFGISFLIWAGIMVKILPEFTLQLPALTGIVTINTITGRMYWYRKPGLTLVYAWEKQAFEIVIGKEIVITSGKDPLDEKFEPEIFSTLDGSISAEYGIVMKPEVRTIGDALDFQKINNDGRAAVFKQITSQFLSDKFIGMSTEDALKGKAVLSRELYTFLCEDADPNSKDLNKRKKSKGQELREEFKVSIRNPELYEVDLPPDIKGPRNQMIVEQERHDSVRKLFGKNPGDALSPEELKLGLASQGTIKYNVNELNVTGLDNLTQVNLPGGLGGVSPLTKGDK